MVDPSEDDLDLGMPGPPLSRRSPFFRGFFFTVGALTALLVGFAVQAATDELILILIAAFLAIGLNPLVSFAERHGVGRTWAVVIVAVTAFALIVAVIFVLGSAIRTQVTTFIDQAPHLIQDLRRNRSVSTLDHRYHVLSKLERKLQDPKLSNSLANGLFTAGVTVVNAIVSTIVVFVLTLYFLAGLPEITKAAYSLAPASRRNRVAKLGDEILHRVGGYAVGAILVALLAGTVTTILLTVVGLSRYALVLGLLVALLDLVPLVGAAIGASVVCLVALATSPGVGITCIVFYLIYETLEGYVIYPRVMRSSVDVPGYVTIVAVLIGGSVGGIVGALLALPLAAALLLLVREVWVRRQDTV